MVQRSVPLPRHRSQRPASCRLQLVNVVIIILNHHHHWCVGVIRIYDLQAVGCSWYLRPPRHATHSRARVYAHAHERACSHARTHAHARTHTRMRNARTHEGTHAHMHTSMPHTHEGTRTCMRTCRDRRHKAYCNLKRHASDVPVHMRYFSDVRLGGDAGADFCTFFDALDYNNHQHHMDGDCSDIRSTKPNDYVVNEVRARVRQWL